MQLTRRRVRAELDTSKFTTLQQQGANSSPEMWNGSPTRFDFLVRDAGVLVDDWSNVEAVTLQIKATTGTNPPGETDEPLVSKTTTSFDASVTSETWADRTKQHLTFALSGAEANVGVGKRWLVLVAQLTGLADPVTIGCGILSVTGDGYDSGAGPRPTPAASYLNAEQSDARYLQRGSEFGAARISAAGLEIKDSVTNVWRRLSFVDGELTFTQL